MLHVQELKKNEITGPFPLSENTHPHSILQVPTMQLAKRSINSKFVEFTADMFIIFSKYKGSAWVPAPMLRIGGREGVGIVPSDTNKK